MSHRNAVVADAQAIPAFIFWVHIFLEGHQVLQPVDQQTVMFACDNPGGLFNALGVHTRLFANLWDSVPHTCAYVRFGQVVKGET